MEWIKIKKYNSDGVIICRNEDIDYLSSVHDDVINLHLKNGEHMYVESAGLFELLRHLEKCEKNTLYGMSVACPCPDRDKCDSCGRTQEVQDLKLENDRLKRRNELMEDYIHAVACIESKKSKFKGLCDDVSCPYYDHDKGFGRGACQLGSRDLIEQEAADIIEKLEEL